MCVCGAHALLHIYKVISIFYKYVLTARFICFITTYLCLDIL